MTNQELNFQLLMSYQEQLNYLKQKYGPAKENYFLTIKCDRKGNIGRGKEGLFCHHDFEYDPENPLVCDLSRPEIARQFTYKYQEAPNLTYCNWLEHLMLHCKINVLRKQQLGSFIQDGVLNYFIPELNDLYRYRIKNLPPWKQVAFSLIEDQYEDYVEIISRWMIDLNLKPNDNWKKLSSIG